MSEQTKSIQFAVFRSFDYASDKETWSAYSRDYSPLWTGYQGIFTGVGKTRAQAMADAIRKAKTVGPGEILKDGEGR